MDHELGEACKITYSSAREELIKSAKNLQRLLPGLEKWKKERDELQLQSHIAEVQLAIGKQKRPYKTVPAVAAWQETFKPVSYTHLTLPTNREV